MKKVITFVKNEPVLIISTCIAIISMFFVPISDAYLGYIDFKVLSILFCLMAVVAGFQKTGLFAVASQKLLKLTKNVKMLSLLLVCTCFFTAMLVTNDVALITFIPLTIGVMGSCGQRRLIFILVMETIAANIGSMLTPIGNPQNLYLYSFFNLQIMEFFKIVFPISAIGFIIIIAFVLLSKKGNISIKLENVQLHDTRKIIGYSFLFLLSILTVLHIVDYRICLAITIVTLLFLDKTVILKVDYSLLITFVAFFIFVGNISSIPQIRAFISQLMAGREFIASVLISQFISNVPAAIMLSGFTDNGKALLLGVNVGGLGTLIASMASLIAFKLYAKSDGAMPKRFILVFTICNVAILLLLVGVVFVISI